MNNREIENIRNPEKTEQDRYIQTLDTSSSYDQNLRDYLSYSKLSPEQKEVVLEVGRDKKRKKDEATAVTNYSYYMRTISVSNTQIADLSDRMSYGGLSAKDKEELTQMNVDRRKYLSFRNNIANYNSILARLYRDSTQYGANSIDDYTYGAPSIMKDELKEAARRKTALLKRVNDLNSDKSLITRILSNQITNAQGIDDYYYASTDSKPVLKDILNKVKTVPEGFRLAANQSIKNDFVELDTYIENYPIRDEEDIKERTRLEKIAIDIKREYLSRKVELDVCECIVRVDILGAQKAVDDIKDSSILKPNIVPDLNGRIRAWRRDYDRSNVVRKVAQSSDDYSACFDLLKELTPDDDPIIVFGQDLSSFVRTANRESIRQSFIGKMAGMNVDMDRIIEEIGNTNIRDESDFEMQQYLSTSARKIRRTRNSVAINEKFITSDANQVLRDIELLPEDTDEDIEFKRNKFESYREFIRVRKNIRPDDYFTVFNTEIQAILKKMNEDLYEKEDLGINNEAFRYVKERYRDALKPLVETLIDDPKTKNEMNQVLDKKRRKLYRRRVRDLRLQRNLTDIEETYFKSTELLTAVSPYLIAAALADVGTTTVYLQNHFESLSKKTKEKIKDGQYFPLVFVGTGPNGIIGIGEIVRKNPNLAREMLVIDQGKQPGGPFGVPNGPAWELNSANLVGKKFLPNMPGKDETKTVRAYGSSDRWYPGERNNTVATRSGSINKLIDWLPDPDDLSRKRYPSNEELQVMLSLHGAVTLNKLALETKLVSVEPNEDQSEKGKHLLTLIVDNGRRIINVRTDHLIIDSGLGEATYGFDTQGKKAEAVIRESDRTPGFPKVSTTLDAFNALADRTREKPTQGFGESIGIYGIGNSTDVLVEYLGRIFDGENNDVRNVKKIYIIATGAPTRRPRYRKIDDLRPRLGRPNIISLVSSRVGDFGFSSDSQFVDFEEKKIIVYDENNRPIRDEEGNIIEVDNLIAATGFKSKIDEVLSQYIPRGKRVSDILTPFALPSNPSVSVAETLQNESNILVIGTGSNPRFNDSKLTQLPRESRDALLRIGPENAVAIGFRGPDSQAAVNIYLSQNQFELEGTTEQAAQDEIELMNKGYDGNMLSFVPSVIDGFPLRIQDNVDEKTLLSSLLSYQLRGLKVVTDETPYTGELIFTLSRSTENDFGLLSKPDFDFAVSRDLLQSLSSVLKNDYFQRYAASLIRQTRGNNPSIDLRLFFDKGKIDPSDTYIV